MRLLLALAALAVFALATTAEAKPKKLPHGEAVLEARITMGDWSLDRDLSYPDKTRCARKSRVRFRCTVTVTGDFDRHVRRCDLVTIVVNRYRRLNYGGYWESVGRLTVKKCRNVAKPYLTDNAAKAAILSEGERIAGEPVTIEYFYRYSNTEVTARVVWYQPGEFGEESCDVDVDVELRNRRVITESGSPLCF